MSKRIRHVGVQSLCGATSDLYNLHRADLGYARYRWLGIRERYKDEAPYRVCKRCLAVILAKERK